MMCFAEGRLNVVIWRVSVTAYLNECFLGPVPVTLTSNRLCKPTTAVLLIAKPLRWMLWSSNTVRASHLRQFRGRDIPFLGGRLGLASESLATAVDRHYVSHPSQTAGFLTSSNRSAISQLACPTTL